MMRSSPAVWGTVVFLLSVSLAPGAGRACEAELRPLRPPLALPIVGPQGIAVDATDGTLWITSALEATLIHVDPALEIIGRLELPFEEGGHPEVTGIAYDPTRDTLYLTRPILKELWEIRKDGSPVRVLPLDLPRPVNVIPEPYPKGLAFDPSGDDGRGSIWLVEAIMTRLYELSLDGLVLRALCHPDDPDGCPGEGRAAFAGDVGLVPAGDGRGALEILGGERKRDRLHRIDLDGLRTGPSYPLAEAGGRPAGFARGKALDPASGELVDALFVTVESSAELHAFTVTEPRILEILDFACADEPFDSEPQGIELSWRITQDYDRFEVVRDGEVVAVLEGSAERYVDADPPPGVTRYELVAHAADCSTSVECLRVVGAGRVRAAREFDGASPRDITEDGEGLLWVTDSDNQLAIYTKDLELFTIVPGPFREPEDETTGIAYDPRSDTLYVYNATTNEVAEIDRSGGVVAPAFPSGVPSDPDDEAEVVSMLYDSSGDGGEGSFWYLDFNRASLEERRRDGSLLRACLHPDHLREPPPPASNLETFAWGLSALPGRGFDFLEVGGGTVRDRRATRFLRIAVETCVATGDEIPVHDLIQTANVAVFAYHRTTHGGREVAFVASASLALGYLFEIDVTPPPLPHPTEFHCEQPGDEPAVALGFTPHGDPESLELRRDGERVALLEGNATSFLDVGVEPGLHEYEIRALRGAERSDERVCGLRVGAGSIARREFSHPAGYIHQVAYDPVAELYVVASAANRYSDEIYRYDARLEYVDQFPSPFRRPSQVAMLAVRGRVAEGGTSGEIYCVGWLPGAAPGTQPEFPVRVVDAAGRELRAFTLRPPVPPHPKVTFPAGMTWDAASDTFWYAARNSRTVTQISASGDFISSFAHPAPLYQDNVIDYGLAIDAERGVLFMATGGRHDDRITKLVEVTRGGRLTGVEIPVGSDGYYTVRGFTLSADRRELIVAGTSGQLSDLVAYRAFSPVSPVEALSCEPVGAGVVHLSWRGSDLRDELAIDRDGERLETLPGESMEWVDRDVPPGAHVYRLAVLSNGVESAGVPCEVIVSRSFRRGDVEENGVLNISDGVSILSFLFLGATPPRCRDAADVDDSGEIELTDALRLLNFLFLAGPQPPPPFDEVGDDPTPDALSCLE